MDEVEAVGAQLVKREGVGRGVANARIRSAIASLARDNNRSVLWETFTFAEDDDTFRGQADTV